MFSRVSKSLQLSKPIGFLLSEHGGWGNVEEVDSRVVWSGLRDGTPPKANAAVVIGVGVGARPGYGYIVASPRPYAYVAPSPYVAYSPGYAYSPVVYPGNVVLGVGYAKPYAYRYAGWRGRDWRHEHEWRR